MARATKKRKSKGKGKGKPEAPAQRSKVGRTTQKQSRSPANEPPAKPSTAGEPASPADPHRPRSGFPIAVIGASAGGLDALKRLLGAMPADSNIALVLVPHLDPRHESFMVELLAKQTAVPVLEARHGTAIRRNHVYVIPPNKYLAIERGQIQLSAPPKTHGGQTAIDFALCSLAEDQQDAAIGIILSGTGSHGAAGIKEIKLAGGVVLVQDPETAEFKQMPISALATGVADYTLPPEGMADVLARYARHWRPAQEPEAAQPDILLDGLRRVLALLQTRTKHDFRHYRKNMITRRVQRRMALLQTEGWDAYVEYLREHPEEVTSLFHDLLIGVTAFFRDPEAFTALAEQVLPKLVARADADRPVRVWVPGCASGEEAYSIAILLIEQFKAAEKPARIQIFATDVDERSLETARQGVYPDSIATAVSAERLKRFFVKLDDQHYQVSKQLRDAVVFAPQNLLSDPPFSRLDLISCRNVLIYLEPDVQEKVLSMLHFALNDSGYLLLGPSESTGRTSATFEAVSKRWHLYRRIGPARHDLVSIPIAPKDERQTHQAAIEPIRRAAPTFTHIMQKILAEDFAPASALINRDYEILSVQGPLVNYLEFPAGEMTRDLLVLARPGLRLRIRSACQQALQDRHTVTEADARVRRNGHYVPCTVTVRPVVEPKEAEGLLLVVFRDRPPEPSVQPAETHAHPEEPTVVEQLERELRATREDLQSTIEQLESSNEELKASNEEIMSMNEELQSTNEELETSKEELQSLNEELATVNNQLGDKVEDLDLVNSDLTNLMAATGVPTVFLDSELRVKKFTPPTSELLNLMTSDVGRPFSDFALKFKDDALLRDAKEVLKTLGTAEKEIQAEDGRWYLRRVLPYQSADKRIDGVVITFFDITKRLVAEALARRLSAILLEANDALTIFDLEGRITAWNKASERMYGYPEAEALKMNVDRLVPDNRRDELNNLLARIRHGDTESLETKRLTRAGETLDVWMTATPVKDAHGNVVAMATTERDITTRRRAEATIRALNVTLERRVTEQTDALEDEREHLRAVLDAATDAIITIDGKGKIEMFNRGAEKMFGYSAAEAISKNVSLLMDSPYREEHDQYLRRYQETREPRIIGRMREVTARRKDGSRFPIQLSVSGIDHRDMFLGIIRDITEQRALEDEIVGIAALEQRHIGQELHDNTQQELTGLGLLAESLRDMLQDRNETEESALAAKLATGIAETNRRLRMVARGLIPVPVTADGLTVALEKLAHDTTSMHGIACSFECATPVRVADDSAALHIYRVAQEAVANAVKHAEARTISIRVDSHDGVLELTIADDGIGIGEQRAENAGLGLRIMEHRCSLIGGVFSVQRPEMGGTAVVCRIPLFGAQ